MKDNLKRILRWSFIACFWVFAFSVRWEGRTLFSHLHGVLVENKIVAAIDESLADLWYKATETARVTFKKLSDDGAPRKVDGA